jgi:peptidoglycan hydrolase-like protein with peptidoglycan-binding domain
MPEPVALGAQDEVVRRLQDALVAQGYFVGNVDGWFGPRTDAAVRYFQSVCGLDVDGVADQRVYDYLNITDEPDATDV